MKFYSSVRLEVRNAGAIKDAGGENQVIGSRTRIKIVKNKFAPPFKTVEFPIIFGQGISQLDIILDMAIQHDIIKKSGSWFSYGEIRLGQGADKTKIYLKEDPKLLDQITEQLKIKVKPESIPIAPEVNDSADLEEV